MNGSLAEFRLGEGRVSGALGLLFAGLALGGALCFRYPAMLTMPETGAFYAAHLGLFRGLLHALLALGFALAATSVVLSRSKRAGLAGVAVAVAAALLGGIQARVGSTEGRAVFAGLDYFLLELLALTLVFIPLERMFARIPTQRVLRDEWWLDMKHFFLAHVGIQILSFLSYFPAKAFFGWAVSASLQTKVAAQPFWIQVAEIILVVDLFSYWTHRAFHTVPALWRFHAVHHSPEHMDWLAGSRSHLVDTLANRAAGYIPIFILGFAPGPFLVWVSLISFQAVFIHANVRWTFPGLRWILATPEFHHWHHAKDAEGIDKNFAVLCPIWDTLFGTAHLPGHWPKALGVVGETLPKTYLGQQAWPFRRSNG
ncbi:MAG: sterol desaturase family protein [Acidobacteria bacterium]|nr:sterol desaturase family protein [Acidobacteriota bacterium]